MRVETIAFNVKYCLKTLASSHEPYSAFSSKRSILYSLISVGYLIITLSVIVEHLRQLPVGLYTFSCQGQQNTSEG